VRVERGDITLRVSATGDLKPSREVELKSKASGQVVRFGKLPGATVEEGELIAELDKRTEQRNLAREESNLMSAEARLQLTRLEYERSLAQSQSEAAAALADEAEKKKERDRQERLPADLVTESQLGAARLAARLAEEKRKLAEAALALIRGRQSADEKLAEADVGRARVAVEDARERLNDTEIRSPIRGILLKKLVEEGQIVASGISASTGGTPIAAVADVSRLLVEANVDETDIARVKRGQPVEVALSGGGNDRFKGAVDLILPKGEIDSNVIVFKVRVGIEGNVFGRAYVGMTATANIQVDERKGVLLVSSEAIRIVDGKPVVEVPDGAGSRRVPVKIGLDNGLKAEILEGLSENAEVLVSEASADETKPGGRPRLRW
jgi:HlyD family secretion protein